MKAFATFALALLLTLVMVKNSAALCPSPYVPIGSGCYYFGLPTRITWDQAYYSCQLDLNGYLIEIDNQLEQDNVTSYIKTVADPSGGRSYWLGATDKMVSGQFRWMTSGNMVTYSAWRPGNPDNAGGIEDCTMFEYYLDYQWSDLECTGKVDPFTLTGICETDPI